MGRGHRDTGVRATVIDLYRVSISYPAAWKHDLVHISEDLVWLFRPEHPLIRSGDQSPRILQIQHRQTEAVERAARELGIDTVAPEVIEGASSFSTAKAERELGYSPSC